MAVKRKLAVFAELCGLPSLVRLSGTYQNTHCMFLDTQMLSRACSVFIQFCAGLQMLEIWAVLDAEPEMNETFAVTLFNPTGGARLGEPTQTQITVLQNQAPLGLFRIAPSSNRCTYTQL